MGKSRSKEAQMRKLAGVLGLLAGAALWLVMLIVTNFSMVTVDIGLVGVLGVTATSAR